MIRIQNNTLGHMLHAVLYRRMMDFARRYTPELPAESVVSAWLNMAYNNDPNMHLIVNVDAKYSIYEHAVIQIVDAFGNRLVYCHQAEHDRPSISTFDEGNEYIKKLVAEYNATAAIVFMTHHVKAMEKRHGFKYSRSMLVWFPEENEEEV